MTRKVIVTHNYLGCDTGCCGHFIDIDDDQIDFFDDHPYEGDDPLAFAKRLVLQSLGEDHVADLDWDNCFVVEH